MAVLAIAGCGSTSLPPPTAPNEQPQALPSLPSGWKQYRNYGIGFAIGLPPGWTVTGGGGGAALIRSRDHLVAVSVTADRTPAGLSPPLQTFANQTLNAIPGFRGSIHAGAPSPFGGTPFQAVELEGTGVAASTGVRERVTVIVLRRGQLATYAVAIAESSEQPGIAPDLARALQMVRTLRDQPPGPIPPPSNEE